MPREKIVRRRNLKRKKKIEKRIGMTPATTVAGGWGGWLRKEMREYPLNIHRKAVVDVKCFISLKIDQGTGNSPTSQRMLLSIPT